MRDLVSILVPAYNGERYIGAALESALAQTHAAIEVIVGDDGSSDATPDIVSAVAARDDRVRLVRNPANLGAPDNQVALHRAAAGEYVKPLLQDDLLAPEAVERLLAGLRADPAVGGLRLEEDLQRWDYLLVLSLTTLTTWAGVTILVALTRGRLGLPRAVAPEATGKTRSEREILAS